MLGDLKSIPALLVYSVYSLLLM